MNETGFLEETIEVNDYSTNFVNLATLATGGTHNDHVVDYLARWMKIGSYEYAGGGEPLAVAFKDYLLKPIVRQKLQGNFGLSGTLGCKITWNTQPFIQGLYVLFFVPAGHGRRGDPEYATGCPHVLVNLADATSAELHVPYVGETAYIPLDGTDAKLAQQTGAFHLISIIPARGPAGPRNFNFTAFLRLNDAKTFGQFSSLPVVQSAILMEAASTAVEAVKKSKVVSSTVGKIGSWLDANSDEGALGTIARTGGWLAGGVSKVLDTLGWSKPLSVVAVTPVQNLPYWDTTTNDSTFVGAKFANNIDAGLGRVDMTDTGADQLLIKNFCREEFIPFSFAWTDKGAIGDLLQEIPYNPPSWYRAMGEQEYAMNHLTYLTAVLFDYWRGNIRLKIQPVMTKFHSGRIRVVFSPGGSSAHDDYENQMFTYNWIIDLSEPKSWEIEIPYVSLTPWRDADIPAGTLRFYVENALSISPSVSSSIDIVMFASMGDNFEVAASNTGVALEPNGTKVFRWIPTELYNSGAKEVEDVQPRQKDSRLLPEVQGELIKFIDSTSTSVDAHSMAIGDPVRSLRACIKRFFLSKRFGAEAGQNFACYNAPFIAQRTFKKPDVAPDFLALVALNYGFWRGGIRYYISDYGIQRVSFTTVPIARFVSGNNGVVASPPYDQSFSSTTIQSNVNDVCKFELPYYARTICSNTRHFTGLPPFDVAPTTGYAHVELPVGTGTTTIISRAAADDYDLGFLVGAPLMTFFNSP